MGRLAVLCAPGSARWRHLAAEAELLEIELLALPWPEVLAEDGDLTAPRLAARLQASMLLKIDSPGDCAQTRDALLAAGRRERGLPEGPPAALAFGEMPDPGLLAAGLSRALAGIERSLPRLPGVVPTSAPQAIAWMADKPTTASKLQQAGVRCPDGFVPEPARDPALQLDRLWDQLQARGWERAYLKLRGGSCGAGIVCLDLQQRNGLSTVVESAGRLFGVRPELLSGEALARTACRLVEEGAWVERALPHARLGREHMDLRVVVLDGEPRFQLARASRWPITNLSLGGRRADPEEVQRAVGKRAWLDARDLAVSAARCFEARVAGVDVLIDRYGEPHVLELNPFGDHFPRLLDRQGRTLYRVQLESWLGGA